MQSGLGEKGWATIVHSCGVSLAACACSARFRLSRLVFTHYLGLFVSRSSAFHIRRCQDVCDVCALPALHSQRQHTRTCISLSRSSWRSPFLSTATT